MWRHSWRARSSAAALIALVVHGCSSSSSSEPEYCDSDNDCDSGLVCGTTDCSGIPTCLSPECACKPDGFRNPCAAPIVPSCHCDDATCEQPLDSCGDEVCAGVCQLGESCQFCLEGQDCEFVSPCLGGWCLTDLAMEAKCRPLECLTATEPPLCGGPDAICGECPEPDCDGRECGEDPLTGTSCGTCGPHRYCVGNLCRQDPQYLLCEGDLQATPEEVEVEQVIGTPPEPQGGTIVDGIYDLVKEREYRAYSVADKYIRGAMRFWAGGTQVEHIYDPEPQSQADRASPHRLMTVSIEGTTLSFNVTCPDSANVIFPTYTRGFTVRGNELWLIQSTVLEIYRRRP